MRPSSLSGFGEFTTRRGIRVVICFVGNISKISLSQVAKPIGSQFWQGLIK
jgi:hypothetical protein